MGTVLGITGGIATGKTTVTAMLRELGAETISADEIARESLAPGSETVEELVRRFGDAILEPDGNVNRRRLGEIVFRDSEALSALNSITHPLIISIMKDRINEFRSRAGEHDVLAAEIPLLIECGLFDLVDKVIVVAAEQQAQIIRLTTRGLTNEEALYRVTAQMPLSEKLQFADEVIRTDMGLEDTKKQVEQMWKRVQGCGSNNITGIGN